MYFLISLLHCAFFFLFEFISDVLSEARVTSGYCPLSRCARALVEEVLFVYSLAVASCGPVNHRLRDITSQHSVSLSV